MEDETLVELFSNSDILNVKVSYLPNAWAKAINKEINIYEALNEIKTETHRNQVTYLRNLLKSGNKEEYDSQKKTLPAVTFCGTFNGERKKEKLKSYNSIIVLDVDKLFDNDKLNRTKEFFENDDIVFAYWESPSQEGIKGLVSLHYNFKLNKDNIERSHKSAFLKLLNYFKNKYNIELDSSGSDTTRLCFFSFDASLRLKSKIISFNVTEEDLLQSIDKQEKTKNVKPIHVSNKDALFNPKDRNKPINRTTLSAIIRFLEKKQYSITYSYQEWYKVAMAIADTFTYEVGEKYFLKLSSLDKEKYNEVNCKNFLLNCYESRHAVIKFRTIIYFANEKGFKAKIKRDRGSEVVNVNLSQVSSSNTVHHLPEDIKE